MVRTTVVKNNIIFVADKAFGKRDVCCRLGICSYLGSDRVRSRLVWAVRVANCGLDHALRADIRCLPRIQITDK